MTRSSVTTRRRYRRVASRVLVARRLRHRVSPILGLSGRRPEGRVKDDARAGDADDDAMTPGARGTDARGVCASMVSNAGRAWTSRRWWFRG